jgi:hypothetical protein
LLSKASRPQMVRPEADEVPAISTSSM